MTLTFRLFFVLALLAKLVSCVPARYLLEVTSCPLDAGSRPLDFAGAAAGCAEGQELCSTCVCAIYDAFVPAFQAANLTYNPASPDTFPKGEADSVVRVCAPSYIVQATLAGVKISQLQALQQCPSDILAMPPCLTAVLEKLTPEAKAAAANAPIPEQNTAVKVLTGAQNGVQKVVDTGKVVVDTGKAVVDTVGSTFNSIRQIFGH